MTKKKTKTRIIGTGTFILFSQQYVQNGQICVDGAAGKLVRLYTDGGQLITNVTPSDGTTGKSSVPSGTYIIQVGSKAVKVVVK